MCALKGVWLSDAGVGRAPCQCCHFVSVLDCVSHSIKARVSQSLIYLLISLISPPPPKKQKQGNNHLVSVKSGKLGPLTSQSSSAVPKKFPLAFLQRALAASGQSAATRLIAANVRVRARRTAAVLSIKSAQWSCRWRPPSLPPVFRFLALSATFLFFFFLSLLSLSPHNSLYLLCLSITAIFYFPFLLLPFFPFFVFASNSLPFSIHPSFPTQLSPSHLHISLSIIPSLFLLPFDPPYLSLSS